MTQYRIYIEAFKYDYRKYKIINNFQYYQNASRRGIIFVKFRLSCYKHIDIFQIDGNRLLPKILLKIFLLKSLFSSLKFMIMNLVYLTQG